MLTVVLIFAGKRLSQVFKQRYKFFMQETKRLITLLNDLIEMNNDRIVGYLKEIEDAGDQEAGLKAVLSRFVDESRKNISELTRHILQLGGEPVTGATSLSAKIFRTWTDVKTVFTGTGWSNSLQFCAHIEEATRTAYQAVLVSGTITAADIRGIIEEQKRFLDLSHDTIQRFLNMPVKHRS